ncbi:class I SAM-dependent methyltransferase [Methylobacterium gnaphalii]|uniref:ATP synthase subunit beta n=1 Tax=Methylobacterium gnaphalii TaxID=1010610 RepID=A0A512JPT8_9HYPH|nr:SAM-dependent methyltransferase [Methylobacterium gnaphalii]GEP11958.1 ATP synthase subunit beta [Methylobacterium gnaphalii]GJD68692.1 hypothetical protein MMMDOFMJ_1616 [Methylobacterium gnaphalii]GLS49410.1 ATP synthase subunit beta [Methylobacterium gnaphalii]
MPGPTPLFREIAAEIRENGPIGLDRYMALCLGHPVHGYYPTRDPLGRSGDFVTAPEISQMFGELIGVWIAAAYAAMGAPERLVLVELGPGRGTLMADALRALRSTAPGSAIDLHLVETSPVLRALQQEQLSAASPHWHETVDTLPDGPMIVVANEFFDALPVRQFERRENGWCERQVGLSADGARLVRGLSPEPDATITRYAAVGVVLTVPSASLAITRALATRLVRQGGALLTIDYGHVRPGFGDTLQALAHHRFVDPLETPGEADLTTHVDFAALVSAASAEGARIHGPVDQRDFLGALGLRLRADRLKQRATPAQAAAIEAAHARLTDPSRRGMGSLFKVLCFSHPSLAVLPGFPVPA